MLRCSRSRKRTSPTGVFPLTRLSIAPIVSKRYGFKIPPDSKGFQVVVPS